MKVIISDLAESDLESVGNYISVDNPRGAIDFVLLLVDQCQRLSAYPKRHPVLPGYSRPLRRFPFRGYSIYYVVDDDALTIVHILHDALNHSRILMS